MEKIMVPGRVLGGPGPQTTPRLRMMVGTDA